MKIQPTRRRLDICKEDVISEIKEINLISRNTGLSIEEITNIKQILEYRRRTDIMIDNFDTFDENISGIDESIKEIAYSINEKTNN
jgi:hypothetical protein